MNNKRKGIHHITVISGDAQTNADFYTGSLGLRPALVTVNQDDPGTYHLFYTNNSVEPGSSITFFPWPSAVDGRPGSGEAVAVAFSVPPEALGFWVERFGHDGIHFDGPFDRFGYSTIRFRDPDGLVLELVFDPAAEKQQESGRKEIPGEAAIRGFWSSTLLLEETGPTEELLTGLLGFERRSEEGDLHLLSTGAGIGHSVILERTGERKTGRNGRGIVHHIAFRTRDLDELVSLRQKVIEFGLSPTGVIDRHVFKSVYFRSPGGVLFELATDGPGYASVAKSEEQMGRELFLPPWLEPDRDRIIKRLPPIEI